jgi:sulfite reductase alpha subunit-like flavoprotein
VADGVEQVIKKMRREKTGCTEEEADQWYAEMKSERYATDVFG